MKRYWISDLPEHWNTLSCICECEIFCLLSKMCLLLCRRLWNMIHKVVFTLTISLFDALKWVKTIQEHFKCFIYSIKLLFNTINIYLKKNQMEKKYISNWFSASVFSVTWSFRNNFNCADLLLKNHFLLLSMLERVALHYFCGNMIEFCSRFSDEWTVQKTGIHLKYKSFLTL